MTIKAAIDLGTNSLRLIIADTLTNPITILSDTSYMCRVGESLHKTGKLSADVMERTHQHFIEIQEIISKYPVSSINFAATSALRDANNSEEFNQMVKSTGLEMTIISGEEEARIISKSVNHYLPRIADNSVFIDQGGGSVEFIHHYNNSETYQSLDIGIVRLNEQFLKTSPPIFTNISTYRQFLKNRLYSSLPAIADTQPKQLIILGGTATTLGMLQHKLSEYDSEIVHGTMLNKDLLIHSIQRIQALTAIEIQKNYKLAEKRADIFLAGLIEIDEILNFFSISSFTVCDKGLRYGLLLN